MDPYQDLVSALAAMRRDQGGSSDERVATAALFVARVHYELTLLVRALEREDFPACAFEDVCSVVLRHQGASVSVARFHAQHEVRVTFVGFDARAVPPAEREQRFEVPLMTSEECAAKAVGFVAAVGELLRREQALRSGSR